MIHHLKLRPLITLESCYHRDRVVHVLEMESNVVHILVVLIGMVIFWRMKKRENWLRVVEWRCLSICPYS